MSRNRSGNHGSEGGRIDASLLAAVKRGDAGEVGRMLAQGVDATGVDAQGCGLLLHLARIIERPGHAEVLQLLLEAGGNPNRGRFVHGTSVLIHAAACAREGQEELRERCIALLIRHGAMVTHANRDGVTALHTATASGLPGVVRRLLAAGAEVDAVRFDGATPLMVGVLTAGMKRSASHYAAVLELLRNGADSSLADQTGLDAWLRAACMGDVRLLDLLQAHGADTSQCDDKGRNALWHAAGKHAAEWLCRAGVRPPESGEARRAFIKHRKIMVPSGDDCVALCRVLDRVQAQQRRLRGPDRQGETRQRARRRG